MASITVIRTRLAANLGTISGLRTAAELPDNPTPPIGIINLDSVDYDGAMQGGLTTYSFRCNGSSWASSRTRDAT
jgi:hypothetical protein